MKLEHFYSREVRVKVNKSYISLIASQKVSVLNNIPLVIITLQST